MLSVEDAQARVMAEVVAGDAELVSLDETLGRVLREEIIAAHDAPAADNSAMDGYAVRFDDIANAPVTLPVRGDIPAGRPSATPLEPGTAMRIMTGAFVPAGADTVVQIELTDEGTERVTIHQALKRGASIRRRGEDVHAGDVVLRPGVRIGPAEIALLAGAGRAEVRVGRRPTVAILSTGDELLEVGSPPEPGKIVNTNTHLLTALVREAGAIARPLGIVRDTREATIAAFERAMESDIIISSGGVSVGAYDFVKDALQALGAETKFWRVSMKPGKPVVLSRLGEKLIFGLPGNPVSCFVAFHLFVAPALRKSMGQEVRLFPPSVRARLTAPVRGAAERRVYARVHVSAAEGALIATPLTSQSSGALTSMLDANGLAVIPEGTLSVEGDAEVVLIGPMG
ncbi:MAG TPA: gephyrin-like molybdotransferase Glp [Thermoanaerobaculia bacterium]|nr:gephyrin-like molybdotransferase Glp [Thermoanaerobaculia bacterium]